MFNSNIGPFGQEPNTPEPAREPRKWDVEQEYDQLIKPKLEEIFIWCINNEVPFVTAFQLTGGDVRGDGTIAMSVSTIIPPGASPTMYIGARTLTAEKPSDLFEIFMPYLGRILDGPEGEEN